MENLIDEKEREKRKEMVKKALAISVSGTDMPTDETIKLTRDYIDGKIDLKELQRIVIDHYNKN